MLKIIYLGFKRVTDLSGSLFQIVKIYFEIQNNNNLLCLRNTVLNKTQIIKFCINSFN